MRIGPNPSPLQLHSDRLQSQVRSVGNSAQPKENLNRFNKTLLATVMEPNPLQGSYAFHPIQHGARKHLNTLPAECLL